MGIKFELPSKVIKLQLQVDINIDTPAATEFRHNGTKSETSSCAFVASDFPVVREGMRKLYRLTRNANIIQTVE